MLVVEFLAFFPSDTKYWSSHPLLSKLKMERQITLSLPLPHRSFKVCLRCSYLCSLTSWQWCFAVPRFLRHSATMKIDSSGTMIILTVAFLSLLCLQLFTDHTQQGVPWNNLLLRYPVSLILVMQVTWTEIAGNLTHQTPFNLKVNCLCAWDFILIRFGQRFLR